jgi:hypothetical protein
MKTDKKPMTPLETNALLKAARAKKLEEKAAQEAIKTEFKAKEKIKALTDKERLDRIEKLLGLDK